MLLEWITQLIKKWKDSPRGLPAIMNTLRPPKMGPPKPRPRPRSPRGQQITCTDFADNLTRKETMEQMRASIEEKGPGCKVVGSDIRYFPAGAPYAPARIVEQTKIDAGNIRSSSMSIRQNELADQVIDHLNKLTGSRYRHSESSRKHIRARISEGCTVNELKLIVDHKTEQWIGTEQEEYLRPLTLFGRVTLFEGYLSNAIRWAEKSEPMKPKPEKEKHCPYKDSEGKCHLNDQA